jgi:hypothetical protein
MLNNRLAKTWERKLFLPYALDNLETIAAMLQYKPFYLETLVNMADCSIYDCITFFTLIEIMVLPNQIAIDKLNRMKKASRYLTS